MNLFLNLSELLAALAVIFLAAKIFTNAIEHAGERLGLSEGVTGSIFAAIATALPEAIVPIVAVCLAPGLVLDNEHVAVGAILGAPLMLSTLTFVMLAIAAAFKFNLRHELKPEISGFRRDMIFFAGAYACAAAALYIPTEWTGGRSLISAGLVGGYVLYLFLTLKASTGLVEGGHGTKSDEALWLTNLRLPDNAVILTVQLSGALALLVFGAFWFIDGVKAGAEICGLPVLILSLLIIPIATELPEKINSIIWIQKKKDTLAFGNISGAMVFQSMLLPAIGITLTQWQPTPILLPGVIITMTAGLWLLALAYHGKIRIWHLLPNGLLYFAYVQFVLQS